MSVFLLFSILYVIFLFYVIVSLLLENRNSSRTLLWILLLLLVPVIGLILYFVFGKSIPKRKVLQKTFLGNNSEYSENDVAKLLLNNSQSVLYSASKIDIYSNGKDTFEAMFEAIRSAKKYIYIEFFIFRDDVISNQLRELLVEIAQAGVKIHLIYDYLGSFACTKKYWKSLREAGVSVCSFSPLSFDLTKINYRNHRKILVVDGKIGFTGGLNIADRYYFGNKLGQWRDTFVKLQGEAVCGLQEVFISDWQCVTKNKSELDIENSTILYEDERVGAKVQIVGSGPDLEWEAIMQGMVLAISSAKKYVYLQTPYFVPNELINSVLLLAAMRGIDVRIMLPSVSDTALTDACTESYLEPMFRAGVKIYKYEGNFMHCKTIVVDDNLSIIGSTNLDERSFSQNFEVNAFIYDKITAEKCRQLFENDLQTCRSYTYEEWKKRSFGKRISSSLARLLSPEL